MASKNKKRSIPKRLAKSIKKMRQSARYHPRRLITFFRNGSRRRTKIDYVVFPVGGPLPERAATRRKFYERYLPLPTPPLSLQTFNYNMQLIIDADNVRGVVLILRGLSAGFGTLQSLRRSIERLRAAGKEVVVYTPTLDLKHYFVASAANRIIVPPVSAFSVIGLQMQGHYFKDALAKVGVSAEFIAISPYKAAGNAFSESTITPAEREQRDSLLDSLYQSLVNAIAEGRGLTQAAVRAAIDEAPFSAETALQKGLIDDIAYDDQLAYLLATGDDKADLRLMGSARKKLVRRVRREHNKFVGVIDITGAITMQPTDRLLPIPGLGGSRGAAESVLTRLLRQAEKDEDMAALVLHIDSPGGDAMASDFIARQVARIALKRPVVAYMNNTAASGGYYISAPAQHIVAHPMTVTGSIGVIMGKVSVSGLFDKLGVNHVALGRGRHSHIFTDPQPMDDDTRAILEREMLRTYAEFRQVVVDGRGVSAEHVDEVGMGRVWTGEQAITHQLVDSHGDLLDAVETAKKLASLPLGTAHDVPVINLRTEGSRHVLPKPFEGENSAQLLHSAQTLHTLLSGQNHAALSALNGHPLCLLPWQPTPFG